MLFRFQCILVFLSSCITVIVVLIVGFNVFSFIEILFCTPVRRCFAFSNSLILFCMGLRLIARLSIINK